MNDLQEALECKLPERTSQEFKNAMLHVSRTGLTHEEMVEVLKLNGIITDDLYELLLTPKAIVEVSNRIKVKAIYGTEKALDTLIQMLTMQSKLSIAAAKELLHFAENVRRQNKKSEDAELVAGSLEGLAQAIKNKEDNPVETDE